MPAIISQELKEKIIAEYAVSNSLNSISKKYNVSWATVRKIVKDAESQVNTLREEKQKKYINDAWEVVNVYLEKLIDPKTIKEAKARECAQVVLGMLERIQKQQELNQQFDVMYYNLNRYIVEQIRLEIDNTPLREELEKFFENEWENKKDKVKKIIREKMKDKDLSIPDQETQGQQETRNLERIFEEVKLEILNEMVIHKD